MSPFSLSTQDILKEFNVTNDGLTSKGAKERFEAAVNEIIAERSE